MSLGLTVIVIVYVTIAAVGAVGYLIERSADRYERQQDHDPIEMRK